MSIKYLRMGVFGPPESRDNLAHNSGRNMFGSSSSSSYTGEEATIITDPMSFIDMQELVYIDKTTVWESGPTSNDLIDGVEDKSGGYWNDEPSVKTRMMCKDKNGNTKYLYNIGHGSFTGDARGQQPLVVGYSGKVQFKSDNAISDDYNSHGIMNVYGMWYTSISEDNFQLLINAIKKILDILECVDENTDDDGNADTDAIIACFNAKNPNGYDANDDNHLRALTNFFDSVGVYLPSIPKPPTPEEIIEKIIEELLDRLEPIIEETKEYIEYLTELLGLYIGHMADNVKLTDFISKLNPVENNELVLGKKRYSQNEYSGQSIWFNLICDSNTQRTIGLLRIRNNGLLFHIACTKQSGGITGTDRNTLIHGVAPTVAPDGKNLTHESAIPVLVDYHTGADTKMPANYLRLARPSS